jgi:hypothetical protein
MAKVIYTKTLINDDGSVATMDYTEEVIRMKRELKRPAKESQETMSVHEVAELMKINVRTVQNKLSAGYFAEGKHYKRLSSRHVVFYKKPLLKLIGLV